jgi:hypothetical protein
VCLVGDTVAIFVLMLVKGNHLGKKADREQLSTEEHRTKRINQEWSLHQREETFRLGEVSDYPRDAEITHAEKSQSETDQPERPEDVLGASAETGDELHRQEVKKPFDKASKPELRATIFSRPMIDDQFTDPEPS